MTGSRNFASRVPHVQPGSAVSAGNTSNATRALEQRTNYLREIVDATTAGRLLVHSAQALSPDVAIGDAVYWDTDNQRFDRALAGVQNDSVTGVFTTLPSSECLGICITKSNATTGDIATVGMVQLTATVLNAMIDGTVLSGQYFLSPSHPGKLVQQQPAVSVAVAFVLGPIDACDDTAWVFINPQVKDFLENHIHYQISLAATPAGTHVPPTTGEPHEITSPDAELRGWLPADHASFNGTAPTGAKFGYNLAAHTELAQLWPPIPTSAAVLEMYQPSLETVEAKFAGLSRVQETYVKLDSRGIWWMTACYNQVPWPTTLDTTSSENTSLSSESVSAAETCPKDPAMELLLSFLKMTFLNDKTVVTSLQPATDEPIEFVNCNGDVANTGELFAQLNVTAMLDSTLIRGGTVFKEIADSSLKFKRGWVAEALYAGSAEVTLTGSHQELLDPDEDESLENPMLHQGIVRITVQRDPSERELNPQIVKLGDALEREYKKVTYIGFPYNRNSAIRLQLNIPPTGLPTTPKLLIRTLIFGRAAGPFAAMTMSYYRIQRPVDGTPVTITEGDTALTFDVVTPTDDYDGGGTNLPVDNAIEVESSEFTIAAGDTIFVTLARSKDATPLFQADVGIIRINALIISGEA